MTAHELAEEGDIGEIEVVGDLLDAFLRVFQLIAHIGQHRLAVGATLHAQAIVDQLAVATEELDLLLREAQDGILIQDQFAFPEKIVQPDIVVNGLTGNAHHNPLEIGRELEAAQEIVGAAKQYLTCF